MTSAALLFTLKSSLSHLAVVQPFTQITFQNWHFMKSAAAEKVRRELEYSSCWADMQLWTLFDNSSSLFDKLGLFCFIVVEGMAV